MKKMITKILALAVAVILMASIAACVPNGAQGSESGAVDTQTGEPVANDPASTDDAQPTHLRILIGEETGLKWSSYPDNPVAQEIAKQTGVTFEFVESDTSKLNVILASGDLPDIVRCTASRYAEQLISGDLIIPLDDLLQSHGQDILSNVPDMLEVNRKSMSNGQDKVYFVTSQVSATPNNDYENNVGINMRWDYYKEIGAPQINNIDDYVQVLKQIVEKHPTTDDGQKVYGISAWNDWGIMPYQFYAFFESGEMSRASGNFMSSKIDNTILKNTLTDVDSSFWTGLSLFYKANRAGVLDPDAFTMKFDDYMAKCTSGQIVSGFTWWAAGNYNNDNAKDKKGYMSIPAGKYSWTGEVVPAGWADKQYSISKNCKTPEKAMELLNYIFSFDGARTMYSGIKGKDWDIVEGTPQLSDEIFRIKSEDPDQWDATGIQLELNMIGLGASVINPADGAPMDLSLTIEARKKIINPLEQDYCDFYNIQYPNEIFLQKISEGKMTNLSSESDDPGVIMANNLIMSAMPPQPDNIAQIDAKLADIAAKGAVKVILSANDEEFAANQAKLLEEFKAAGVDEYTAWYEAAWNDAKANVGAK